MIPQLYIVRRFNKIWNLSDGKNKRNKKVKVIWGARVFFKTQFLASFILYMAPQIPTISTYRIQQMLVMFFEGDHSLRRIELE